PAGPARLAFLPRHGRGHRISPTEVPARANIFALKTLGVEWIISVSAVGSLREEIAPLDLVIPDQIIDRTKSRVNSFFENGLVAHVGFADPFCPVLSELLFQTASETKSRVHRGGTLMVMEGPLFSTRAESNLYRSWGASIIGMTALPEAKLAREAEICYATLACTTDYDCWHETEADVTIELIIGNLLKNVAASKSIIRRLVDRIPQQRTGCLCPSALASAIVTSRELIPEKTKTDLAALVSKYL
ncbi:MAG: S-methyl-5'-thioadenosine phosphorylase, partial [Chloroflexota bacterium]